jgi:hypothetical protein
MCAKRRGWHRSSITLVAFFWLAPVQVFAEAFEIVVSDVSRPNLAPFQRKFDSSAQTLATGNEQTLVQIFPGYTNQDRVQFQVNYRGLPVSLEFPAGQTKLTLSIPECNNFSREFNGTSRDASNAQVREFFKKDDGQLNKVMNCLVARSGTDPATRLLDRMVGGGWFEDVLEPTSSLASESDQSTTGQEQPKEGRSGQFGIGLNVGRVTVGGIKSNDYSLPVSYTMRFDKGRALTFGTVLSWTDFEGSRSYAVAPRVNFRLPIKQDWLVSISGTYGAAASKDLGSAAQLVSSAVTSTYTWHFDRVDLTLGNLLGYYRSIPTNRYGYHFDPEIRSTGLRNGLLLSQPLKTKMFGTRVSAEYFVTDTRYFGTNVLIDQYNEIGFSLGTDKRMLGVKKLFRAGITVTHGENIRGATLNFGYKF